MRQELDGSDYDDAAEHIKQHRMAELHQIFPSTRENEIIARQHYGLPSAAHVRAAMLQQDVIAVAQDALQRGQSPAMRFYELAQEDIGRKR